MDSYIWYGLNARTFSLNCPQSGKFKIRPPDNYGWKRYWKKDQLILVRCSTIQVQKGDPVRYLSGRIPGTEKSWDTWNIWLTFTWLEDLLIGYQPSVRHHTLPNLCRDASWRWLSCPSFRIWHGIDFYPLGYVCMYVICINKSIVEMALLYLDLEIWEQSWIDKNKRLLCSFDSRHWILNLYSR